MGCRAVLWWRVAAALLGLTLPVVGWAIEPMTDAELSKVEARDGFGFALHLELNSGLLSGETIDSRFAVGFNGPYGTTYAVVQNFGGIVDMLGLTLTARTRPDGGDYLDFGLPTFVSFKDFGFRAMAAQTDPTGPITASYGQVLLNGSAQVQGHVLLWSR